MLLDPTYTSYSYRVVASGDTGGKVYAQQSQISFQIDRTTYQATVNVPDANEIYAAYKLSSNGSLTWNSGFSSQYDVFGYRLELFASTGGRVGVYEGRAAQAVITPTADFTTVRLTKYGTFVSEYVYDTENYQVFKPTGSVNASETPTQPFVAPNSAPRYCIASLAIYLESFKHDWLNSSILSGCCAVKSSYFLRAACPLNLRTRSRIWVHLSLFSP